MRSTRGLGTPGVAFSGVQYRIFTSSLAHHPIILASEVHSLFDPYAIDFDEHLAFDFVGELLDVPLVEFAVEALGYVFNKRTVGYKRIDSSLIADKPLQGFFNRLGDKSPYVSSRLVINISWNTGNIEE